MNTCFSIYILSIVILSVGVTGLGTDEDAVVWILGHRNASQRRKIKDTYQQLYNKSLLDDLHAELSGDFRVIFSNIFSVLKLVSVFIQLEF